MRRMQYHMGLLVTLSDETEMNVSVYRSGRSIELRFCRPGSGRQESILVHPINAHSVDGWISELQAQTNLHVKTWEEKTP